MITWEKAVEGAFAKRMLWELEDYVRAAVKRLVQVDEELQFLRGRVDILEAEAARGGGRPR